MLELRRAPPAGRLRLRGHAVQLHVDRRQPADGAGHDGQHVALEAGVERRSTRPTTSWHLRGGRPARRRHQLRARLRSARSATRSWPAPPGRRALHRLDPGLPGHVEDHRREHPATTRPTRASSARPAARTSSSPTRSADVEALVTALVRGAFEYQGQKCSAASRAYIPESLWPHASRACSSPVAEIKMGAAADFRNFMGAVIDEAPSPTSRATSTTRARAHRSAEILCGGELRRQRGLLHPADRDLTTDPTSRPWRGDLRPGAHGLRLPRRRARRDPRLCDTTSPYALTGAIFAQDRAHAVEDGRAPAHAAGNFYINDKPTGAVVGQQPFGGGRASGTNDKAGSSAQPDALGQSRAGNHQGDLRAADRLEVAERLVGDHLAPASSWAAARINNYEIPEVMGTGAVADDATGAWIAAMTADPESHPR
jgi:hypothetical protein